MGIFTLIFIALSLAMDSFAVAIANGAVFKKRNQDIALKFAITFAIFQFGMTILGFMLVKATRFMEILELFDHWIAFILLFIIGYKMTGFKEINFGKFIGIKIEDKEQEDTRKKEVKKNEIGSFKNILFLGFVTSMDAFVVGATFVFIPTNILLGTSIIGVVTLILTFIGFNIGNKVGLAFQKKAEIFGGILLILIGFKILIEHLFGL